MLAAHAEAVVASVDYRMAPEYKFPFAVNDCFDVLKWVGYLFKKCTVDRMLTMISAKPMLPP